MSWLGIAALGIIVGATVALILASYGDFTKYKEVCANDSAPVRLSRGVDRVCLINGSYYYPTLVPEK